MLKQSIPLLLLLVGCVDVGEDADPETGGVEQALDGEWHELAPFCNEASWKIGPAIDIANTTVRSPEFRECMIQSLQSYTESFPETILDQLKLDTPAGTAVSCISLGWTKQNGGTQAFSSIGIVDERLYIDPNFLADGDTTYELLASVIVHEVLHNRGYEHPMNNSSSQLNYLNALEYAYSINEQAEACALKVSTNATPRVGNGPRRDSLAQETRLAPTGWAGGSKAFRTSCADGKLAAGVYGRAHTYVDSVGLVCKTPQGTGTAFGTAIANGATTGGDPYNLQCQPDEVMIGLYGHAASVNDRIGPICALATKVANGTDSIGTVRGFAGGDGGHTTYRRCPAKMAVRSIKGKYGNVIDRMELDCQNVNNVEPIVERWLSYAGDDHPNTRTIEKCAGRAALVALTMHAGDKIDRLGGKCLPVTGSFGLPTNWMTNPPYMMSAWGGTGGYVYESNCPAGQAVVGADIWYDDNGVNGIVAACAIPSVYATNPQSLTYLPIRGTWNGTKVQRRCAAGELMVGWMIASGTIVDGLQPLCRAF
jgi:hypothetical protein